MVDHCVFYQGWSRYSRNMEKFLKKQGIDYTTVYQNIGDEAKIFLPGNEVPILERNFGDLKSRILTEKEIFGNG